MISMYLLVVLCGLFAGFITTLAGLGSVLTLYVLMDVVQLPPDVANGTNRLGIMAMCLLALPSFQQNGYLDIKRSWLIIVMIFIGAMFGFILAITIDNTSFVNVFKYLLILMLLLVIANPKRWIQESDYSHKINIFITIPLFFVIGFYAGFIQVGTGIFLILSLAILGKYSLLEANGIKLSAFAIYTAVGLIIFSMSGKINWPIGLSLAIGQGVGALITARIATKSKNANKFVRYLLIAVLIVAIIHKFGLYTYFIG